MKKLALILVAITIGTASLFANNTKVLKKPTDEMRMEIIKLVNPSEFVVNEDITVTLKFTFNSEGEMVLLCPGCDDKEMRKYIGSKLNYKKFNNPGVKDKVYKMQLAFKKA